MQDLPAILVAEDDHLIRSVVEEALKEGVFETMSAHRASRPPIARQCRGQIPVRS